MNSVTTGLTKGIRVDQATQKGSVYDVIHFVTQGNSGYSARTLARLSEQHPELNPKWMKLKINGKGRATRVADAATLVEIAWVRPGKAASQFRRQGAESVCRLLGGDLTLVDQIQRRHAQVAGTGEEAFLLAEQAAQPDIASVAQAQRELPYTMEQMERICAMAGMIVSSKADIKECTGLMHEFPLSKYTQYMELWGKEVELKGTDVGLNERQLACDKDRFGLRQREDEHNIRMGNERLALEERKAKRQKMDTTEEGVTFNSILKELASGVTW